MFDDTKKIVCFQMFLQSFLEIVLTDLSSNADVKIPSPQELVQNIVDSYRHSGTYKCTSLCAEEWMKKPQISYTEERECSILSPRKIARHFLTWYRKSGSAGASLPREHSALAVLNRIWGFVEETMQFTILWEDSLEDACSFLQCTSALLYSS